MRSNVLMRGSAAIVGVLVWLALGLQLLLSIHTGIANGNTALVGVARYFSFFTILTNILVALVLTVPLVLAESRWERFFSHPSVRTATAVYIAIVGIVYSLVLRQIWNPQGWQLVADRMLHDFSPLAYLAFWLAFVPKSKLRWSDLPAWLIYPLGYCLFTLARGAIFNWYPYPFIDAAELGYPQVFLNILILFAGFSVAGLIFIALGRFLGRQALESSR